MPEEFNKNFIPQKRVDPKRAGLKIYDTVDTFTALALILFTTSIFVVMGVLGSRYFITNQISSLEDVIAELSSGFNAMEVQELVDLDKKVLAASGVLERHTSVTDVRNFLEEHTQSRVQVLRYSFEDTETEDGLLRTLMIEGEALNYNTLANQQTIYQNDTEILTVTFSDMKPTENGTVSFVAKILLTDTAFSYNSISQ